MANVKITDLTAASAAAKSMLFEVTQDPAGTPASRKLSLTQLFDLNDGTKTSSAPILNLAQTWNSGVTTFTAIKINVTDTASASGSLFADFQVAGSSKCSIQKNGAINVASTAWVVVSTSGAIGYNGTGQITAGSAGSFNFGSSGINTPDTFLYRDAANTLAQRNGTTAQSIRIYNTYTDASNYERFFVGWSSNTFYVQTENAGTGSERPLVLSASRLDFRTSGTYKWAITSGGHILANTDNTYDIGASGATRPRNGYFGGSLTTGAPNTGTAAAWKLGTLVTAAVTPDTTRYIELDVAGTLYKLIVAS